MLVGSEKIRHPDETARLISPTFVTSLVKRCLWISFYVYGPSVGELNIRDQDGVLLWQYVGRDEPGIE